MVGKIKGRYLSKALGEVPDTASITIFITMIIVTNITQRSKQDRAVVMSGIRLQLLRQC